jgi:DNA sulfur modification protein DndE
MIDPVRVVETDRDLLARLKRSTGIKNWNILCRWAFVLSVVDANPTSVDPVGSWSSVEMTWRVFGGPHADVYWALLVQRVHEDGLANDAPTLEREFNRHLHRGIGLLANLSQKPTIRSLVSLVA